MFSTYRRVCEHQQELFGYQYLFFFSLSSLPPPRARWWGAARWDLSVNVIDSHWMKWENIGGENDVYILSNNCWKINFSRARAVLNDSERVDLNGWWVFCVLCVCVCLCAHFISAHTNQTKVFIFILFLSLRFESKYISKSLNIVRSPLL